MAVRQYETVTVGPSWIRRIVLQVVIPEYFGHIRHAHWGARMA